MATKLSPMAIIKKYFHTEEHPCTMAEMKAFRAGMSTTEYKKFTADVVAALGDDGKDIDIDFSNTKETPAEVAEALRLKAQSQELNTRGVPIE